MSVDIEIRGNKMAEKYMKNDHIVSDEIVMEAKGICKSFPGVKALSDVDITCLLYTSRDR